MAAAIDRIGSVRRLQPISPCFQFNNHPESGHLGALAGGRDAATPAGVAVEVPVPGGGSIVLRSLSPATTRPTGPPDAYR